MNLAEALRLEPGDKLLFGRNWRTAKIHRPMIGTVIAVTAKGGIRISRDNGPVEWIAYSHVIRRAKAGEIVS